tara:strand:+ start:447 stop:701 length:255 start_codon:yes stop_codon:yes gene_type:complete
MDSTGSRAEVFHGTKKMTAGGLTKKDFKLKDGRIVSKAASQAALKRMKSEGKKHLTKVFKPAKNGFKLQPKEGTAAYKKLVKKM